MILKVFSNLNDPMILCLTDRECLAKPLAKPLIMAIFENDLMLCNNWHKPQLHPMAMLP